MSTRRKVHTFTCCTDLSRAPFPKPADPCKVCGCAFSSPRHREPSNRHYHEFKSSVPTPRGKPALAPAFVELER